MDPWIFCIVKLPKLMVLFLIGDIRNLFIVSILILIFIGKIEYFLPKLSKHFIFLILRLQKFKTFFNLYNYDD